jgi:cell division septation protein DedD
MADDGIHEIQLNGKQLVFLFMTATVVVVVIFLCGVMVGRGVRAPGAGAAVAAAAGAPTDPTAEAAPPSSVTDGAPVATSETLTYSERLEAPTPPAENLKETDDPPARESAREPAPRRERAREKPVAEKPVAEKPVAEKPVAERPVAERPVATVATSQTPREVTGTALSEPAGNGFVVQVASVNRRAEADTIAKKLASKGYPSFVTTFGTSQPVKFRVRVGKYSDRRQAESIAAKLKSEEQFNPWITR